jgi:hypothetical protein
LSANPSIDNMAAPPPPHHIDYPSIGSATALHLRPTSYLESEIHLECVLPVGVSKEHIPLQLALLGHAMGLTKKNKQLLINFYNSILFSFLNYYHH